MNPFFWLAVVCFCASSLCAFWLAREKRPDLRFAVYFNIAAASLNFGIACQYFVKWIAS